MAVLALSGRNLSAVDVLLVLPFDLALGVVAAVLAAAARARAGHEDRDYAHRFVPWPAPS